MSADGGPITPEQVDRAVEIAVRMRRAGADRPLDEQVREAVRLAICACVLDSGDDLERHLTGTHAAVVAEVRRRAEQRLAAAPAQAKDDPVDEASEESFPASDPPGWIWERPDPREQEE